MSELRTTHQSFNLIAEEVSNPPALTDLVGLVAAEPGLCLLDADPWAVNHWRAPCFGYDPFLTFSAKGDEITISLQGEIRRVRGDPFQHLQAALRQYGGVTSAGDVPIAGAIGYFGYDLRHHLEKLPAAAVDDLRLPDCIIYFYDRLFWFEPATGELLITSSGLPLPPGVARERRARERLQEGRDLIARAKLPGGSGPPELPHLEAPLESNMSKEQYCKALEAVLEYIAAGDIYQANISQRFATQFSGEPWALYRRLRSRFPAPFGAYLHCGPFHVLSNSPERFLLVEGNRISTCPIKGTRPRGMTVEDDARIIGHLRHDPKECAEHVMIVDLERNDLGRICQVGSVHVEQFETIETYHTLHHMVSTVAGTLEDGIDPIDCLRATFPGGSITGAPKIRAMEVIDEVEPTARGLYTGAIGFIGFSGGMELNIAIRTAIATGGRIYFQTGGGIVADSSPAREYEETLLKAETFFRTLGVGAGFGR
ncbi:MAG: aminodeoxychorismate synthase component I [candidate division NC10 bacterium]|nr:aminodeoxychorismate synthase component I [candidate division NC10 bacterium]MDE2320689.1 aminodeoxychorismate synthase component I [candidate division NC10 bacterium]